jgi:hypothetical protein
MPSVNLEVLMRILIKVEGDLGELWGDCQNFEHLERISKLRQRLMRVVGTIKMCLPSAGGGGEDSKVMESMES